jgi:type II secretory pathway pseudopilin PulG
MGRYTNSKGQLLVELLVAFGIGSILIPALLTVFVSSRNGKVQQEQRLLAIGLLKEGEEAVRSVREADWNNLPEITGTFHPVVNTDKWQLVEGEEEINGFTRRIDISDLERNGKFDPSTKKVDIKVTWINVIPFSVESTLYLSRYLKDALNIQTTKADFDAGILTNTNVTNVSGGEVQLGAGGKANWCEPNLSITPLDLPKSGVANAISAIEGRVFAGTGDNSSGVSFANVVINNTDPPTAQIVGTIDGYKTNGIFGENDYVYIATDNNFKEVVIIQLTQNPYTEVGYFDAPKNGNAGSVYVSGSTGYMTSGDKFYNFDLTSKTGSRDGIDKDGVTLAGTGNKIVVVGNYAYVAVDSTSTQMQIIDLSNPSDLKIVGQAKLSAQGGKDLYVNQTGTRVYLATNYSASQKNFFILDITSKTGDKTVLGSFSTNGMYPKGVTVVPGNRAIVVGTSGEEYQVLDISNETTPTKCGGLNIDSGVNGLSSVLEADGDAFSYIITGDVSSELKIIEGGPGGKYAQTGGFESSIFDAVKPAAFNRFIVNYQKPANTDIKFQISGADPGASGCNDANYAYVGPDLTSNTFFATSSAIPLDNNGTGYENPARCFRYKVLFETNEPNSTPIFTDMTINYSP